MVINRRQGSKTFEELVKSKDLNERSKDIAVAKDFPDRYAEWLSRWASDTFFKERMSGIEKELGVAPGVPTAPVPVPTPTPVGIGKKPPPSAPIPSTSLITGLIADPLKPAAPKVIKSSLSPPQPVDTELLWESVATLYPELAQEPREIVFETLAKEVQADTEVFLSDIRAKGRSEESVYLLKTFFDVTDADVAQFFAPSEKDLLAAALPDLSFEAAVDLIQNNPNQLNELIRKGGPTLENRKLLRAMGLEWGEIYDILRTKKVTLDIEGVRRLVTVQDNNMVLDEDGQEIGRLNPATDEFEPYQYRLGDTWKNWVASVGDAMVVTGGVIRWIGPDGIGEKLSENGRFLQSHDPPDPVGEFTWQSLFNPRWWGGQIGGKIIRNAAPTVALLPAYVIGAAAGSVIGGAFVLGKTATFILQVLGAGALSAVAESAMEAGGGYDEVKSRGGSDLEAKEAAFQIFKNDLMLLGTTNFAELAVAFAPVPTRVFERLISKGLLATARAGGRVTITGLTNSGQEVVEEAIQRSALDKNFEWDAETREAALIGLIFGVGFGAGGEVYNTIKSRTIQALSPELKAQFDEAKADALARGLKEERADEAGLDAVSDNKEVQDIITAVTEQVKIEELQKEIKPKDAVEEVVWEQTFEKMKREAPQVPAAEIAEVLPKPTITTAEIRTLQGIAKKEGLSADEISEVLKVARSGDLQAMEELEAGESVNRWLDQVIARQEKSAFKAEEKLISQRAKAREAARPPAPTAAIKPPTLPPEWVGKPISRASLEALDKWPVGKRVRVNDKQGVIETGIKPSDNEAVIVRFDDGDAGRVSVVTLREISPQALEGEVAEAAPVVVPARRLTGVFAMAEKIVKGAEKLAQAKETIKALRQRKAKTEDVQAALVSMIKEHLPLSHQGELLAKVKNVKTDADLLEAQTRVEELAEAQTEKQLIADIAEELKKAAPRIEKGITVGRLSPEVQPVLTELQHTLFGPKGQSIVANTAAYEAAREQIAQNIAAYQVGKMSWEDLVHSNETLKYTGIHGMSVAQLQETLDYIQDLKRIGKDIRKGKFEAIKQQAEKVRTAGLDEITGGRGIKAGAGALRPEDLAADKSILDQPVNSQFGLGDLLDKLGKFKGKGTEAQFKGFLMVFNRAVQRATNAENAGRMRNLKVIRDKFGEIYGVPKAREAQRLLSKLALEDVDLGTFPITTEKGRLYLPIKLTRAQMMEVYQLYKNPKNLETFKEGHHWPPEVLAAIVSRLSTQDIAFADWLQEEFYDTYYDRINPVYRDEFNIDMPKNPHYVPQSRDFTAEGETEEATMLLQDQKRYASVTNKSLKARQANTRPFKFNGVIEVAVNHVLQMEHFMAWAKTMHELRGFFGNTEVRTVIRQYHSQDILVRIDSYMNDLARGGKDKAQFVNALDKIRSRLAVSVLALKPSIGLQQIWTVGAFMTEMKTGDFVTGFADFWKHPVLNYKWMMENSTYLKARYEGGNYERDIRLAQRKDTLAHVSGITNISEYLLWQITQGDKFGVMPGWWAKYKAGLKEGLGQEDAMLEADMATERTQNTSEIASLAWLQRGSSLGALVSMFQSQPNKYFRIIANNIRNMQYGRVSKVTGMKNLFIVWVLLPALFQLLADAGRFKKERQARVLLLGPLNDILAVGQMVQTAWGWFTDDSFEWQASPVLSTSRDLMNFSTKLMKVYRQEKDPYKDVAMDDVVAALEFLAKGLGQLTGLPTPYLVQVEKALRRGDPRQLVFSQWALEEPTPGLHKRVGKSLEGLGEPMTEDELKTGKPLSEKPLPVKDMAKLSSELREIFSATLPQDITAKNGFDPYAVAWAEKELSRNVADALPNIKLSKINTDSDKDDTIVQYYQQWQVRQKIDSLAKLREFDQLYPKAYLGNVTRAQYETLVKFAAITDKAKRELFLEAHPELKVNLRDEWLKANPEDNARLAIWGQDKLLTQAAYDVATKMVKALGIPPDAVDKYLPPKDVAEAFFELNEVSAEWGGNSWEAKLILAKNPKLGDWLEREPIDTPIASLELKVKNRKLFDLMDSYSDRDSPAYLDDVVEDANGLTARDKAQAKLKANNPEWVDDMRRIEAIEAGSNEKPTDEKIVEAWVEKGRVADESPGYDIEEKLWYVDNPEVHEWALAQKLTTDDGRKWNIPAMRISAKWRIQDEEYDALPTEGTARSDYLAENGAYRLDRRRRDAYGKLFPTTEIEHYVQYYELPSKGFRQERFLVSNPIFAQAMHKIAGIDLPDPKKVPAVQYDEIYERYQASFDKLAGLSDNKSKFYIEDEKARERARNYMRLGLGEKITEFGKAEIRRAAYGKFVPEKYVGDYVGYYSILAEGKVAGKGVWFADDRFLMEHISFYREVYLGLLGLEKKDFRKVPTAKVEALYNKYLALSKGEPRKAFRRQYPDLDEWLVSAKGYVPISPLRRKTAWELLEEQGLLGEFEKRFK